ncbi:hypothetical protein CRG98_035550 [Punica granatum]|uniref:Uncharacterized protein n=1 Tax=Punica granatum TaxID=22663 RepID=A0A2I0IJY6_PUNGR|nr:hypothetical protein CRG98_035550 [Punica granatum]
MDRFPAETGKQRKCEAAQLTESLPPEAADTGGLDSVERGMREWRSRRAETGKRAMSSSLLFSSPLLRSIDVFGWFDNWIHCKSRDRDLGLNLIEPGRRYPLSIAPYFFDTMLFFCKVSWVGGQVMFDFYEAMRDDADRCTEYCMGVGRKDAIVGFREDSPNPDIVTPWKNVVMSTSGNIIIKLCFVWI